MAPAVYSAKPARVGNSQGYRLDAAFFREHPDMAEACDVMPIGDGAFLLVRHAPAARRAPLVDPLATAYLAWLDAAMQRRPTLFQPLSAKEFALAEQLVAGVTVDLEADRVPDDFELP
jgi:hypothetical protein